MTPDDEPTTTDTTTDEASTDGTPDEASTDATSEETSTEATSEETSTDATPADEEGVEAEDTMLEKSQAAIDDAHEAVRRVADTDAIGEDATGAGDLPAFADSTDGAEKPDPDEADDA
jgi:hypothetical protein